MIGTCGPSGEGLNQFGQESTSSDTSTGVTFEVTFGKPPSFICRTGDGHGMQDGSRPREFGTLDPGRGWGSEVWILGTMCTWNASGTKVKVPSKYICSASYCTKNIKGDVAGHFKVPTCEVASHKVCHSHLIVIRQVRPFHEAGWDQAQSGLDIPLLSDLTPPFSHQCFPMSRQLDSFDASASFSRPLSLKPRGAPAAHAHQPRKTPSMKRPARQS